MAQFAPTLSKGEAETLVRGWIDGCLWRREAHRAETNGFDLLETDEIARMPEQDAREIDSLLRLCGVVHAREVRKDIGRVLTGRAPFDRFADVITAAGKSLGHDVDPATSDGRLLGRTILRGYATLLTELQETIATIPRQVGAALTKPAVPNFPFLQFWSDFERHKVDMREWKGYTTSNAASTAKLFKGFFPAASVAEVYKAA